MKIWYIKVNGKQEGPFSYADLKRDRRLTPDTLVWKQGFETWLPIREVSELKNLFKDEEEVLEPEKEPQLPQDELVLDMRQQPPFLVWILIALAIASYFALQLMWSK